MGQRALAVVHGVIPDEQKTILGSLLPAMENRGFTVEIVGVDDLDSVDLAGLAFICVTGSPDSVYDEKLDWVAPERQFLQQADAANVPILGVCFGGQILASALGGSVSPSPRPEHGFTEIVTTRPELVSAGPWMEFHHDTITPPDNAEVIARTEHNVQAFTVRRHLGLQFHPEITPECFDAWRIGFTTRKRPIGESGVDIAAVAADIRRRAAAAAADADELLGRFLIHAGVTAPVA